MATVSLALALAASATAQPSPSASQFPQYRFQELPRQAMERTSLPCESSNYLLLFDADSDGSLDMLFTGTAGTTNLLGGSIPGPAPFLYMNDGHGRLSIAGAAVPGGPLATSSLDARAGDIDGDGDLDVFYAVMSAGPTVTQSRLFVNDGSGRFTDEVSLRLPRFFHSILVDAVAMFDIDADGDLDLCLSVTGLRWAFCVLANDGTGHFSDVSVTHGPAALGYPTYGELHTVDVDRDGDLDLISNARGGFALHVFINDGAGRFTDEGMQRIRPAMPQAFYFSIAPGDVDQDGDVDFAATRGSPQPPDLFLNDGTGHFDPTSSPIPGGAMGLMTCALVDLDDDGDLDLFASGASDPRHGRDGEFVWVNDGSGGFTEQSRDFFPYVKNGYVSDQAVGDFDQDGDLDVILTELGGGLTPLCRTRYYVNLTRQLYAAAAPLRGAAWNLEVWGPSFGVAVVALAPRKASLPLGPLGSFRLDPATAVVWPALVPLGSDRHGILQVPVPATLPAGVDLFAQALVVDPSAPGTARLTNVWAERLR